MAARRINVGKGFFVVGVLSLVAFVGTVMLADRTEAAWRDERADVQDNNVARVGTGQDLDAYPDAPLLVRQTVPIAIGAALVVAVVGVIIVLLAVIASGQRR
jgi:ABC-type Fe3+ transport system permease subunit